MTEISRVIDSYFSGDSEFTQAVVKAIDAIMASGDVNHWAELKRFDAHAAKNGKIAPDQLLNLVFVLINRACNLDDSCFEKFKDILYDRMEGFHNPCRDQVPASSTALRKPKHLYLHGYNAKSYGSILQLLGTFLQKWKNFDSVCLLGKRVAANHNHWFNFGHLIDFTKSMVEAGDCELWTHLGAAIFSVVSGLCGTRLTTKTVIMDSTGVDLSDQIGWIGSLALDVLPRVRHVPTLMAALNCLASLRYRDPGHGRVVLNALIEQLPLEKSNEDVIHCELLNALISILHTLDCSEWPEVHLESATTVLLKLTFAKPKNVRLKASLLVWLRLMCYAPLLPSVWAALLGLDSGVMDFVLDCLADEENEYVVGCAAELVRLLLQRDMRVGRKFVSVASTLVSRTLRRPVAPLTSLSWSVRRSWKANGYILHQCILREPKAVLQMLNGVCISGALSRMLLDPDWEDDFSHEDNADNNELCGLGNYSHATLVSLSDATLARWMADLELQSEQMDAPDDINNRLEYWLVHDNPDSVEHTCGAYSRTSARLMALYILYECGGALKTLLLGLTETAIGVVTNDTVSELVSIDALLALLNSPPHPGSSLGSHTEYLFALKVIGDTLDEDAQNRVAVLKNIQHLWPNRFAILACLLEETGNTDQVAELLRVVAVEFVVANHLVNAEAQHVANMRAAGAALIAADVSRGHLRVIDFLARAFESSDFPVPQNERFVLPELRHGKREILAYSSLTRLVDNLTATVLEYGALVSERERSELFAFLVESVDPRNASYKFCVYTQLVPKLLLNIVPSGEMLPFYLRMLKGLCLEAQRSTSESLLTRAGLVESVALCLVPFTGSQEIWMIEKHLCRSAIEVILDLVCETKKNSTLPLSVVLSLITSKSFVAADVLRELVETKYKARVELLLADLTAGPLMKEILDALEAETTLHEIGI